MLTLRGGLVKDAEALRKKAAELLEQAKVERDPEMHGTLFKLAAAFVAKARELDRGNKLN
jgi:hypothetical protein